MVETDAAVGLLNLQKAKSLVARRLALMQMYCERLKNIPGCLLQQVPPDRTPSGCNFVIRIGSTAAVGREVLIQVLRAKNIESKGYYWPPAHAQPFVTTRPHRIVGPLPVTWALSRECLALPLYADMTEETVARVCTAVESVLRG
jgi:dTDP-4-amino-4,6-dideoxygalactose transaminase